MFVGSGSFLWCLHPRAHGRACLCVQEVTSRKSDLPFNLVQQNRCSCVAENLDLSIRHRNHQRHPSLTFHLDVLPICSCGCLLFMIN